MKIIKYILISCAIIWGVTKCVEYRAQQEVINLQQQVIESMPQIIQEIQNQ
jgi:hypothetical protein